VNARNQVWVAFDVEDCIIELLMHVVHGFEGVVLEDFLANFIPQIFLWIGFGRIGGRNSSWMLLGTTSWPL
jgi:hypothetical protein